LGNQDSLITKCLDQFEKSCYDTNMGSTNDGGGFLTKKKRAISGNPGPNATPGGTLFGSFDKIDEVLVPLRKAVADLQAQSHQTEEKLGTLLQTNTKRPVSFTFAGKRGDKKKTIYV
jgi:hypothetical protein